MPANRNLHSARASKQDEFYTHYSDITAEMQHYTSHFKDKVVLCNCDDPRVSQFPRYFRNHFSQLQLHSLISIFKGPDSYAEIMDRHRPPTRFPIKGNGDFRDMEYMQHADIIVTNPPFSLFREFMAMLQEQGKQFLVIGSENAITYKDFFPLLMKNKVWMGVNKPKQFALPSNEIQTFGNITWFTNLDIPKRHKPIPLKCRYHPDVYPHYDNFDAIEVSRSQKIPMDWPGIMGVPISFLNVYSPDQFVILGDDYILQVPKGRGYVNGLRKYARIYIKHINPTLGK
jgi:hypothetical protein